MVESNEEVELEESSGTTLGMVSPVEDSSCVVESNGKLSKTSVKSVMDGISAESVLDTFESVELSTSISSA